VLLGGTPAQLAAGAGSIWAVSPQRQTVSRIDSKTLDIVQTIDVGSGPGGIAYSREARAVWVANGGDGTLSRIDQATNRVVDTPSVGNVPVAVAAGFGSVWVTNAGDRTVVRLDAKTGLLLKAIPTGDVGRGIAIGGGAVWVSDDIRGRVSRIDPRTNEVTEQVPVGGGATALAYGADSVWVANGLDRTVMRIDPTQNVGPRAVPIGGTPGGLAFADGDLWVSDEAGGKVVRIDPRRNKVVATIKTGNRPQGVAFAGGRLWVPVQPAAVGHRGGVLRVVSDGRTFDSLDPGLGYDGPALNVLTMLYDGLTSFQRVGNPDGTKLVPDLATSLPAPTDDARTYVFHLRPGIRYSNGQLVRPADFRYGIERVFALNPEPNRKGFYDGIRGAASCIRIPRRCDLSRGIVTDPRAGTVTFHLAAPDPDFLRKLALPFAAPVPEGTPKRETIVPATGPYHIARYTFKRRLELRRNPHFREWSKAAKPDGYPDRISWTLLPGSPANTESPANRKKEVRAVEQGREDVAFDGVPDELQREVEVQYPSQVHLFPLWGVTYLWLNTRVPPFRDVRVRRAVNYAADREAALPASAQDLGAQTTCQILPPNFPAFRRYCPYTRNPDRNGFWNAPDLEQARRLIAASGTKGAAVTIWVPGNQTSEGPIAAALMRSLGYRTRLKHVGLKLYYFSNRGPGNPRSQMQAGLNSWYADYPAPSNYITTLFSCASTGNYSHFCDHEIEARIRRALTVPTSDPYAANQLWAQIDRAIVDQAPVVPLITHKRLAFVSKRVGNYEYIPHIGVLLDQLWVK
jgi:peptide/nickel transport system substrate-binding protein